MNIGMILDTQFPPDPRVEREALALKEKGHKVSILCLSYNKNYRKNEEYNGLCIIRNYLNKNIYNKSRPLVVNFPFYNTFWKSKIISFIKNYSINILHVHDLPLMPLAIKICKQYNIKVIGDFHENFSEAIKMYTWATGINKIFLSFKKWENYQEYAVKHLHKIVVCAQETKDHFSKKYGRKEKDFSVVENTISVNQFMQQGIDLQLDNQLKKKYENRIVFGFVGVVIHNRGLQHFIQLLPELIHTNIKVVIIGRGKLIKTFKEFIQVHKCTEMVDWYDWVDFSKIATYINNFDVGITRLERNAQNDYTTANKLFQYMYLKKPVLTSNSLPMKRIVEKLSTGIVFPSNDSEALKKAVLKLLEDAQLRKELGENGRKAVMDIYNWENSSKELINLYKED